jgi:hypothetical protein
MYPSDSGSLPNVDTPCFTVLPGLIAGPDGATSSLAIRPKLVTDPMDDTPHPAALSRPGVFPDSQVLPLAFPPNAGAHFENDTHWPTAPHAPGLLPPPTHQSMVVLPHAATFALYPRAASPNWTSQFLHVPSFG